LRFGAACGDVSGSVGGDLFFGFSGDLIEGGFDLRGREAAFDLFVDKVDGAGYFGG
jgi:hypothetical protein